MSNSNRYPTNTLATVEDFLRSPSRQIIDKLDDKNDFLSKISELASQCSLDKKYPEAKILWLFYDVLSMALKPDGVNNPFMPLTALDRFTNSDLELFAEILPHLNNLICIARLADVLWVKKIKKVNTPVHYANIVIDAYIQLADISFDDLLCERAIVLCFQISAHDKLKTIVDPLVDRLLQNVENSLEIAKMLRKKHLAKDLAVQIAEKLEQKANSFDEGKYHIARDYFNESMDWYNLEKNQHKVNEIIVAIAETYIKQSDQEKQPAIATLYIKAAIYTLQNIPISDRADLKIDEEIKELRQKLFRTEQSIKMVTVSLSEIDVSELCEESRSYMRNKPIMDGLRTLANIRLEIKEQDLRTSAENRLAQETLLGEIFPLSPDGRLIKKPKCRVLEEMIRLYGHTIERTEAQILPALDAFICEHHLRESDLITLVRHSPIIPIDRAELVGKALFAGFEKDFVTALHLAVPQIEHMVRWHLKNEGAITTYLDKDGTQTENGLSTLIDLDKAKEMFDENLLFEIRALFCEQMGANLRNNIAHGLLDFHECQSTASVYAWWLLFRIVFNGCLGEPLHPEQQ